jgi:hypothetical protein
VIWNHFITAAGLGKGGMIKSEKSGWQDMRVHDATLCPRMADLAGASDTTHQLSMVKEGLDTDQY